MNLRSAAWHLARKDLRLYFRDRTGMALGFLLPLGLVTVMGFMMSRAGGSDEVPKVEIAIVDEDRGPAAAALIAALQDSSMLTPRLPKDGATWSAEDARRRVSDGDEPVALVIPPGYADGAELQLFMDPGRSMERQLVSVGLMQALIAAQGPDAAWSLSQRMLLRAGLPASWTDRVARLTDGFRAGVEGLFDDADAAGLLAEDRPGPERPDAGAPDAGAPGAGAPDAGAAPSGSKGPDFGTLLQDMLPVQRIEVAPEGRARKITFQVSHAVSGMTVMMLLFSLVSCGRSLIEERDRGALRRLLAAPIDPRAILLSKFVSTFLIGLLLIAVLFGFAAVVFRLDVLSRLDTLIVMSVATAAACTAFAIAIAAWAATEKQADGVATLIILVMAPIGGCWMPLQFLPEAVQSAARFTLPYWSLRAYQGSFWYGQHWTEPGMLAALAVQLGIAAGLTLLASALFRRRHLAD